MLHSFLKACVLILPQFKGPVHVLNLFYFLKVINMLSTVVASSCFSYVSLFPILNAASFDLFFIMKVCLSN